MASKLNSDESDYLANFSPQALLDTTTLNENLHPKYARFVRNLAEMYHEIFSVHQPGERLLDVGSGPTLYHLMSASAKYKNITLSDPLPENRLMQEQYISDIRCDQKWIEHFKLTAKLEGDVAKWPEIRNRLRASIRNVMVSDILQGHPIGRDQCDELYDCVMSMMVLTNACKDIATVIKAIKNVISLTKPGAPVVFSGLLGATYYEDGENRFPCLTLTPELICKCVEDIGCNKVKLLIRKMTPTSDAADFTGIFGIEVRKQ